MITRFVLSTIALLVFILPCALSAELRESKTREERELHSAEQTIEISLAAMSAPAGQDLCSRSPISCVKPDAIETSLALIACHRSKMSLQTLAQLLRFRLDAGGAEDFDCYVLRDGKALKSYLLALKPADLAKKCRRDVDALVSKETALRGLATNSVCAEEEAMRTKIKELISAINTNRRCDPQDF